eukprot:Skav231602  [mRNA]  locus=scaffold232:426948:434738:+ [translate_table: standard]
MMAVRMPLVYRIPAIEWGKCSAECGKGITTRHRSVVVLPNSCGLLPVRRLGAVGRVGDDQMVGEVGC